MTHRGRYRRAADLDSWRRDPRIAERGFVHRWISRVEDGNGEDAFLDALERRLRPHHVVLDLGCGHGELSIDVARRCARVVAVDREPAYLELARELAAEARVDNVTFVQLPLADGVESSAIPVDAGTLDLVVDRRGPVLAKWLTTVRPLARRGASALVLHPAGGPPAPAWADELPEPLRPSCLGFDEVASWVVDPLRAARIQDYRLSWFDVPEWLSEPAHLYERLAGPDAPSFESVRPALERVFVRHGGPDGVSLRHERLLADFAL